MPKPSSRGTRRLRRLGFADGILVEGDADGEVIHSEMLWPEGGRVMIHSACRVDRTFTTPVGSGGVCVVVTDPDAVYAARRRWAPAWCGTWPRRTMGPRGSRWPTRRATRGALGPPPADRRAARSAIGDGVGPKQAARLVRLDGALAALGAGVGAAEVAATHGYADQAHLSREVRDFLGLAPSAYLALRETEFTAV